MYANGILDNFELPGGAREDINKRGLAMRPVADGIQKLSGHDDGMAFQFFMHDEYNQLKSKGLKCQRFDTFVMIRWLKSKRMQPTERIRFLPEELLFVDEDGVASGRYAAAYENFKKGAQAPGLQLSNWGVLASEFVATLVAANIFTVEQLAEVPMNKIASKFPEEIRAAHERAVMYVNSKDSNKVIDLAAEKVAELERENAKMRNEMAQMQAQMQALFSSKETPSKTVGKPKGNKAVSDETKVEE